MLCLGVCLSTVSNAASDALPYKPETISDPFKQQKTMRVDYEITDPQIKDFYSKIREVDCASNETRNMGAIVITTPDSSGVMFQFSIFQNIIVENKKDVFETIKPGKELIFLMDGKPSTPLAAFNPQEKHSSSTCINKITGKSNYTKHYTAAGFILQKGFELMEFVSSEVVEYKIYTDGIGYTGVIPKDVRKNIYLLLLEK